MSFSNAALDNAIRVVATCTSEKMKRNRCSDDTGRYSLPRVIQVSQVTLLVFILELRMREGEYSVLKAPPLAVSRDETELYLRSF